MTVSIIITCYNRERYVARAIRSALNQKFPRDEFEVIVVDDGSTDHSPRIVADYDGAVTHICHERNAGVSAARNVGIRRARGQFVVNLDSDDYMHEHLIDVEHLHLAMNPHWGAVSCDYLYVDEHEQHIRRVSGSAKPIACGIMFRKDALIKVGLYDEKLRLCEEQDLRLRLLTSYHIGHVELPLYRYTLHADNITSDSDRVLSYEKAMREKYERVFAAHADPSESSAVKSQKEEAQNEDA